MYYKNPAEYWSYVYQRILKGRKQLWKVLLSDDSLEKWFITRIFENHWSIDEILRHIFASEYFYLHSASNNRSFPKIWGVGAQWVGSVLFGLKEGIHYSKDEIFKISIPLEKKTILLFSKIQEHDLSKLIPTPWGENMSFNDLIHHCFEHEYHHRGQISYLASYFKKKTKLPQTRQ